MDSSDKSRRVCQALPTNRHAVTIFDMVANMLGGAAVVFEEGAVRHLCYRDPDRSDHYLPWPLLRLAVGNLASLGEYVSQSIQVSGGPLDLGLDLDSPPESEPLIANPPRLRGIG